MTLSVSLSPSSAIAVPDSMDPSSRVIELPEVGRVGYRRTGTAKAGPPLLLLHSVNAVGSCEEMRPLARAFGDRPVYSLDWPGFGNSDRGPRAYRPELFACALTEFIKAVGLTSEPVDVVASALGGEFAARAAIVHPRLFRSLTLIAPTGMGARQAGGPLGSFARELEKTELLSRALFWTLTARPLIQFAWTHRVAGKVDLQCIDAAQRRARRDGGHHATFAFLKGDLFTPDATPTLYQRLRVPTFVLCDDAGTGFECLPQLTRTNPFVRALRVAGTRGLPHIDRVDAVERRVRDFYAAIDAVSSAPVLDEDEDEGETVVWTGPSAHAA